MHVARPAGCLLDGEIPRLPFLTRSSSRASASCLDLFLTLNNVASSSLSSMARARFSSSYMRFKSKLSCMAKASSLVGAPTLVYAGDDVIFLLVLRLE